MPLTKFNFKVLFIFYLFLTACKKDPTPAPVEGLQVNQLWQFELNDSLGRGEAIIYNNNEYLHWAANASDTFSVKKYYLTSYDLESKEKLWQIYTGDFSVNNKYYVSVVEDYFYINLPNTSNSYGSLTTINLQNLQVNFNKQLPNQSARSEVAYLDGFFYQSIGIDSNMVSIIKIDAQTGEYFETFYKNDDEFKNVKISQPAVSYNSTSQQNNLFFTLDITFNNDDKLFQYYSINEDDSINWIIEDTESPFGVEHAPILFDNNVLFGVGLQVHSVNLHNGTINWKSEDLMNPYFGIGKLYNNENDYFIVANYDGNFSKFDPSTGEIIWALQKIYNGPDVNDKFDIDNNLIVYSYYSHLKIVDKLTGEYTLANPDLNKEYYNTKFYKEGNCFVAYQQYKLVGFTVK